MVIGAWTWIERDDDPAEAGVDRDRDELGLRALGSGAERAGRAAGAARAASSAERQRIWVTHGPSASKGRDEPSLAG